MDVKRKAFIDRHQGWIDFLNNRDKLPEKKTIDFAWKTPEDLIIACADFMYENLRCITRGYFPSICPIKDFGLTEVNAILKKEVIFANEKGLCEEIHDSNLSIFPTLALYLKNFLSYIHEILDGGLRDKAKLGIYKVGVCPYAKKNKPECGVVFVGKKWDQDACDEHAYKWHALKGKRKERLKKKVIEMAKAGSPWREIRPKLHLDRFQDKLAYFKQKYEENKVIQS